MIDSGNNLQAQHDELEMLQAIYPDELKFEEDSTLDALKSYLNGDTTNPPAFIDFAINLTIEDVGKFEFCATLSHDYPTALPEIYLRNPDLNRTQSAAINNDCIKYVTGLERNEPCLYSAISWLQENATKYSTIADAKDTTIEEGKREQSEKLTRLWIYSHHIYAKTKRREILYLAQRLHLGGFCMPGKPGVICVEGRESDCAEWWTCVRAMTWQKIACKVTEDAKRRRFESFEEVGFQTHGTRGNHSDLGELYQFLVAHDLAFIFKELFGVEGGA